MRKKVNLKQDSPVTKLVSKNTLTRLARSAKSKLYKPFPGNPDMPDLNAMTDERIEEIIQSERAYQQVTTQLQRFVRVITVPLDSTNKLGNNDAQISQYLEKRLPEARKELVALETACQRVKWTGTDEVLTALYASETDGIYFMALLKLNRQQWWNSQGKEIPNFELERRHLLDFFLYS